MRRRSSQEAGVRASPPLLFSLSLTLVLVLVQLGGGGARARKGARRPLQGTLFCGFVCFCVAMSCVRSLRTRAAAVCSFCGREWSSVSALSPLLRGFSSSDVDSTGSGARL